MTILSTFDYKGLQIREEYSSKWKDVPKMEGCAVVNIGNLLSEISNGVLVATNHRVVDLGVDRYIKLKYLSMFLSDVVSI